MSEYSERFDNHGLWPQVEALGTLLPSVSDANAETAPNIHRISRLHAQLLARRALDGNEIPINLVNELQTAVTQVTNSLQTYADAPDANTNYLEAGAGPATDAALDLMHRLPPLPADAASQAMVAAAKQSENIYTGAIRNLTAQVDALQAQIDAQKQAQANAAAEHATALQTATAQAQADLEAVQQSVIAEQARVTQQAARLDAALTDSQTAFAAESTERATAFQDQLTSTQASADEAIAEQNDKAKDARDTAREEASDALTRQKAEAGIHITNLLAQREEATKLVEEVGRRVITADYGQYAEQERKSARNWNYLAVSTSLIAIVVFIVEIIRLGSDDISLSAALTRLGPTLAFLAIGGYAGKRASEHHAEERDAKRTQLDINALEPFLSRLPDDQATTIRAEIADRVFARRHERSTGSSGLPSADLEKIIDSLLGRLGKPADDATT